MQDFASRTCTSRTTRQVPLKKTFPANSKRCSVTMWYLILSHWNITQSPLAPIAWIKRLISPVYHSYNLKHTQQDYHDLNSQTDSENLLSFTSLQTPGLPIRTENSRRKHRRFERRATKTLCAHSDIFNQCFSRKHRRPLDLPSRMKSRTNTALISRLDFRCSLGPPGKSISSNRAYDFGALILILSRDYNF